MSMCWKSTVLKISVVINSRCFLFTRLPLGTGGEVGIEITQQKTVTFLTASRISDDSHVAAQGKRATVLLPVPVPV